ncbi:MAG: PAS domain-containing protein [bacterium]|nr:PAS domain-containing protein [bacterium]
MKQTASLWLFTYWNELRNGRKAPNRFEIEPRKIGLLLPDTFILETDETRSFRFRLAGTKICETYGYELKGVDFISFWKDRNDHEAVESLLHTIKEDGSAGLLEFTATNSDGEDCRFEILLLPLIHSGERVNRIMGSLSSIDDPYWLGSKRLKSQKLDNLDLIWPDIKLEFSRDETDDLTIAPSGIDRIVSSKGRLFRVIDGGKG